MFVGLRESNGRGGWAPKRCVADERRWPVVRRIERCDPHGITTAESVMQPPPPEVTISTRRGLQDRSRATRTGACRLVPHHAAPRGCGLRRRHEPRRRKSAGARRMDVGAGRWSVDRRAGKRPLRYVAACHATAHGSRYAAWASPDFGWKKFQRDASLARARPACSVAPGTRPQCVEGSTLARPADMSVTPMRSRIVIEHAGETSGSGPRLVPGLLGRAVACAPTMAARQSRPGPSLSLVISRTLFRRITPIRPTGRACFAAASSMADIVPRHGNVPSIISTGAP